MDPMQCWNDILTQLELDENPRENAVNLLQWLNKNGWSPSIKYLGTGGKADRYVIIAALEKILEDFPSDG